MKIHNILEMVNVINPKYLGPATQTVHTITTEVKRQFQHKHKKQLLPPTFLQTKQ